MRLSIIFLIIIILSTSVLAGKRYKYDPPDFNPKYKDFNSYFRKLDYYKHGIDDWGRTKVCKHKYPYSYRKHYCTRVYYEDEYIPKSFQRSYHQIQVKYV